MAQDTREQIASFDTAALFFQFSDFDSPSPLLFHRPDAKQRTAYAPEEYISIVLDGRLGAGAVGDVYSAFISSPRAPVHPFVVKMAFTPRSVQRMKHEHAVYKHLTAAGVTGIPTFLGFHSSTDDTKCVLMLSNVGRPLGEQMDEGRKVLLSSEQWCVMFRCCNPSYLELTRN
jgi:hypothetical protein